jgi:hypothetical protein
MEWDSLGFSIPHPPHQQGQQRRALGGRASPPAHDADGGEGAASQLGEGERCRTGSEGQQGASGVAGARRQTATGQGWAQGQQQSPRRVPRCGLCYLPYLSQTAMPIPLATLPGLLSSGVGRLATSATRLAVATNSGFIDSGMQLTSEYWRSASLSPLRSTIIRLYLTFHIFAPDLSNASRACSIAWAFSYFDPELYMPQHWL